LVYLWACVLTWCMYMQYVADQPDVSQLKIGKYKIIKTIGQGGMGMVYLAEDDLGREVALKQLVMEKNASIASTKRFLREARALARLQHPNICRIYGFELFDSSHYIVMEYLQGITLSEINRLLGTGSLQSITTGSTTKESLAELVKIANQTTASGSSEKDVPQKLQDRFVPNAKKHRICALPVQMSLTIVMKICEAVQYAHENGVIHRDLKPSNIIIRADGEPVILDFGLAKVSDDKESIQVTVAGALFGTLGYMPPEQISAGADIDERADIYSLGVITYELFASRRFFSPTGDIVADVKSLKEFQPRPLRKYNPKLDEELETIVSKATASEPQRRYRFVNQLHQDFQRYLTGQPINARPPTYAYRWKKFVQRHHVAVRVALAFLVPLVAVAGYIGYDYYLHVGRWIDVYSQDFTKNFSDENIGHFSQVNSQHTWQIDSTGLHIGRGNWCWFLDAQVAGDCRIAMRLRYVSGPDGIEVAFGSKHKKSSYWMVPHGYSVQIGGYGGAIDLISINRKEAMASVANASPSSVTYPESFNAVITRIGNTITLEVNGKRMRVDDFAPMIGQQFRHIGLHAYETEARLERIRVSRLALPRKNSPLIVGELLLSNEQYDEASQTFIDIERDHDGGRIGREALLRAYYAATMIGGAKGDSLQARVEGSMRRKYPDAPEWEPLLYMKTRKLWNPQTFPLSMQTLTELVQRYPESTYLNLLNLYQVPPQYQVPVMHILAKSKGRKVFDIPRVLGDNLAVLQEANPTMITASNNGITSLKSLASMDISWLSLPYNNINDLQPIATLKHLKSLYLEYNYINDVSALEKIPVRTLALQSNAITDIAPIASTDAHIINISHNFVEDLSPLAGKKLTALMADFNAIGSIEPLRHSGLRTLRILNNPIKDFSPLQDMPLREIHVSKISQQDLPYLSSPDLESVMITDSEIHDLSVIVEQKIASLTIDNCRNFKLESIAHMDLRDLYVYDTPVSEVSALRNSPVMTITLLNNQISSLHPLKNLQLGALKCSMNPLKSLGPFVENPPDMFEFFCPLLPEKEIMRAVQQWQEKPDKHSLVRAARALLYVKRAQYDSLRLLGERFNGHTYLAFAWSTTWSSADSAARAWGGHLATFSSIEEELFVIDYLSRCDETVFSLGMRNGPTPAQWVGEPENKYMLERYYTASRPMEAIWDGEQIIFSPPQTWRPWFVIEWDA